MVSTQSQVSNISKPRPERQPPNGRTESGGLGFLFTVWSHNPQVQIFKSQLLMKTTAWADFGA